MFCSRSVTSCRVYSRGLLKNVLYKTCPKLLPCVLASKYRAEYRCSARRIYTCKNVDIEKCAQELPESSALSAGFEIQSGVPLCSARQIYACTNIDIEKCAQELPKITALHAGFEIHSGVTLCSARQIRSRTELRRRMVRIRIFLGTRLTRIEQPLAMLTAARYAQNKKR